MEFHQNLMKKQQTKRAFSVWLEVTNVILEIDSLKIMHLILCDDIIT